MGQNRAAVTFVQFGDFREASLRLRRGEAENYNSQRRSVEFVWDLQARHGQVAVVSLNTAESFDTHDDAGIRVIGAGPMRRRSASFWNALLDPVVGERLVLRTPYWPILSWTAQRRCRTLATLADSFHGKGLRERFQQWRTVRALSVDSIEWVANHGRSASRQLVTRGMQPAKIVPWDWPATRRPEQVSPKHLNNEDGIAGAPRTIKLFFAGALSAAKGVDDIIEAVSLLRTSGRPVELDLAGAGELERLRQLVARRGLDRHVRFVGLLPNDEVFKQMRAADLVVVASHHHYPEGMPMTIYEALASRTPLLVSDHPMIVANLGEADGIRFFPAGSAEHLTSAITEVMDDSLTYDAMSVATSSTWERLQLPVEWTELVGRWIADTPNDRQWIERHSLANYSY